MSKFGKEVVASLESDTMAKRFELTAPEWMTHEAEVGFAAQHLKANKYLLGVAQKEPESLYMAMSNVAAVGLSLNPALKHAYLVPRKGKICFDPGYQGLIDLGSRGSLDVVSAEVFYEGESFKRNGAFAEPDHDFDPFDREESDHKARGFYCVAKMKTGSIVATFMSVKAVNEIRDNTESVKKHGLNPKAGPWVTNYVEMGKKTVIRRAFKTWTLSSSDPWDMRLAEAVEISNKNEGIKLATSAPDLGDYSDEAKAYYDQLITNNDSVGMVALKYEKTEAEWISLYHSFEKGTKGNYQKIVDSLTNEGEAMIRDIVDSINEGGDIETLFEETPDQLREIVKERVSNEAAQIIAELERAR